MNPLTPTGLLFSPTSWSNWPNQSEGGAYQMYLLWRHEKYCSEETWLKAQEVTDKEACINVLNKGC